MNITHQYLLIILLIFILFYFQTNTAKKVSYIAIERPILLSYERQFVGNLTITSRRYSRRDPLYYLVVDLLSLDYFGNNCTLDFSFYHYNNNRYTRTFFEIRSKLCDFIIKNNLFGVSLTKSLGNNTCPFPPKDYHLNLTMPLSSLPSSFPYKQGRLYLNVTVDHNGNEMKAVEGYMDIEIKAHYKKN